jgi:uncharacterized protein
MSSLEMVRFSTPGVYFERQDEAITGLEPVRTDIAGFVGIARRGPLHQPVRVESWTQFVSAFGTHTLQGYLSFAVQGFFANGGQTCYVVRIADPSWAATASLDLKALNGRIFRLKATSPGVWAHSLRVTARLTSPDRFTFTFELPGGEREVWRHVSLDERTPGGGQEAQYIVEVLNGPAGSSLVNVELLPSRTKLSDNQLSLQTAPDLQVGFLQGGADGVWTLKPQHLSGEGVPPGALWGLAALEPVKDVSIVAIPDTIPPRRRESETRPREARCDEPGWTRPRPEADPDHPPVFDPIQVRMLQDALVAHCERLKDRVAIVHTDLNDTDPEVLVRLRSSFSSGYAALYHPWLGVMDGGELTWVPPSGHMAGIYARVERQAGPHKPPGNEVLEQVVDVRSAVDETLHGYLNDHHINVIRELPGRGIRVMGTRTLSRDPLRRHMNVRRLLIMIERSIERQTQWLVFEPNNHALWREVDRVVRSFLDNLWQRGMLDGAVAAEAYSVTCDETTNPRVEADLGRLTTLIGVQPPWPAEFVLVRLRRTEQGSQFLEGDSHA